MVYNSIKAALKSNYLLKVDNNDVMRHAYIFSIKIRITGFVVNISKAPFITKRGSLLIPFGNYTQSYTNLSRYFAGVPFYQMFRWFGNDNYLVCSWNIQYFFISYNWGNIDSLLCIMFIHDSCLCSPTVVTPSNMSVTQRQIYHPKQI